MLPLRDTKKKMKSIRAKEEKANDDEMEDMINKNATQMNNNGATKV